MQNTIQIQSKKITSSQEWAFDPGMVLVTLTAGQLAKAEKCHSFLVENKVQSMSGIAEPSFEFYKIVDAEDEDDAQDIVESITNKEGEKFALFTPEYRLDGGDLAIDVTGELKVVFPFSYTGDRLNVELGLLDELRLKFAE